MKNIAEARKDAPVVQSGYSARRLQQEREQLQLQSLPRVRFQDEWQTLCQLQEHAPQGERLCFTSTRKPCRLPASYPALTPAITFNAAKNF